MGRIRKPLPGRLIVSIIYSEVAPLQEAVMKIEKKFGHVEFETDEMEFLHTTYYREEMGENLKRKFFAFSKPAERHHLAEIKIWTNKLEEKYGEKTRDFVFRKVNIDPGIMTPANFVLASTKDYAHRIYLSDGIYAELCLMFEKKQFRPLPWTYPDYTEPKTMEFLTKVRETMKGTAFEF